MSDMIFKKIKYIFLFSTYLALTVWKSFDIPNPFLYVYVGITYFLYYTFRIIWFKKNVSRKSKFIILLLLEDLFIFLGIITIYLTIKTYNPKGFTNFFYTSSIVIFLIPTIIYDYLDKKNRNLNNK